MLPEGKFKIWRLGGVAANVGLYRRAGGLRDEGEEGKERGKRKRKERDRERRRGEGGSGRRLTLHLLDN